MHPGSFVRFQVDKIHVSKYYFIFNYKFLILIIIIDVVLLFVIDLVLCKSSIVK